MKYIKCELERDNVKQTSWLPVAHAKIGNVLSLKNINGEWVEGWKVISADIPEKSN